MLAGYVGRILHVNLSTGNMHIENPPDEFYRKYVGGSAMGLAYLLRTAAPTSDPLGPENVLTFMLSAPTGAAVSGQSRMCANARSPLTGGIGDAQCGGFFPAELKFAGFDGIVFQGRSAQPVYLWVHDGQAELRPAGHLWGKTTTEAEGLIKEELGDRRVEVAQVGPAGEKLSSLAAIINMGNRANGRTGLGAVMGSKNLKAVAVRGSTKKVKLAEPKRVQSLARGAAKEIRDNLGVYTLQEYGTAGSVSGQHLTGTLPTRNYNEGQFARFEEISGEAMKDTILVKNDTCYACTVRCKRVVETEWSGRAVPPESGGPEYETIGTFGSYCLVDDLPAIAYANMVCNEFGLDTIGTGATIAWAMECYANGLLSDAEIGFPLRFGDATAMTRMVDQLARREGFGAVLADGSAQAADKLGLGHDYLITIKGTEAPAHMPQAKRSLALIYAVNPFGADHQSHEHDPSIESGAAELDLARLRLLGFDHTLAPGSLDDEKVDYALKTQLFYSFLDSAGLCQFVWGPAWQLYGPAETLDLVRAVTGWGDFDIEELLLVGERRVDLMRLFNARAGLGPQDDTLPAKFFRPLQGSGPTAGEAIDRAEWEQAKELYYERLGWDAPERLPSPARLAALGIEEFTGLASD